MFVLMHVTDQGGRDETLLVPLDKEFTMDMIKGTDGLTIEPAMFESKEHALQYCERMLGWDKPVLKDPELMED